MTASPGSITGAQSVTFSAIVTPSVEFTLTGWTWTPDSGSGGIAPNACTTSEKTCTRTISKSGWMKATTTIGPYTLTDSARVFLIPCPTSDSIADREGVRALLRTLWSQSNPSAPPASRIERGGHDYDSAGTDVWVVSQQAAGDSPCANSNPNTSTLNLITGVHIHPFSIGDTLPWSQCFPTTLQGPGQNAIYGHGYGGASGADWVRSYAIDHRPGTLMDADSIYIYGPPDSVRAVPNPMNPSGDSLHVPAGNWQAKTRSYPRNAGSCTRP